MTIAAYIGVLDEAGLIGPCIDHLRSIGVSKFIVCDMGSTDGTAEILRREEGPDFHILWSSNEEAGADWLRRNSEAVAASAASWVVLMDADEFPLPASGDLGHALAEVEADVVRVPRYNVVQGPSGLHMPLPPAPDRYDAVELYVENDPEFRQKLAVDPALYWLRFVPKPKLVIRPRVLRQLIYGMHDIIPRDGMTVRRTAATNIVTAHVALTDYDRFARKLDHVRDVYRLHKGQLPPNFAWHWRRWLDLAERGELRAEYDRSILSPAGIAALRADGTIRTAAQILDGHNGRC